VLALFVHVQHSSNKPKLFPLHLSLQDGNGAMYIKISNC